ncbi:lipoyl(octanoyl) transferase LipB [Inmirania thermothiophila]|uniref:Octanoyltransferase n=1 Tax=Inmirania thermothiophila TaxID=1750597 RepID=A0A3N1Y837_9GAMM|nr:lipoyl(octanoyl) transferase LipB [Inmirania thermothiophila]ROR34681.1 lipoyl(octanoyl) transferase [Inmirania thermothiophila]
MSATLQVRRLGRVPYEAAWRRMQAFTAARTGTTDDELWLLEHPPVYTLGLAGREAHVRDAGGIPVVRTDRGGQVTYHGPGQVVAYLLLDLARLGLGVRGLVRCLEEAVMEALALWDIRGARREGAPGVYVDGRKIASLGLRVRRGRSYHGLALNVAMDLAPFRRIDPCGHPGLEVTQVADLGGPADPDRVAAVLADVLARRLGLEPVPAAPRLEIPA